MGVVDSRLSSGFDMAGFYWDLGWVHQRRVKSPGRTIYGGSGGGGQFGTGRNRWFCWEIGVDGTGGGSYNGVGCWLNGWVRCWYGFQIKM